MSYDLLSLDFRDGGVAVITLNRPPVNALNLALVAELGRQPWAIRDVLRIGDATWLPRGIAPASCVVLGLVSLGLAAVLVRGSRRLGRDG